MGVGVGGICSAYCQWSTFEMYLFYRQLAIENYADKGNQVIGQANIAGSHQLSSRDMTARRCRYCILVQLIEGQTPLQVHYQML